MPLLYLFGKRDAQTINIINQINSKKNGKQIHESIINQ